MKILVTGGAGYLGSILVEKLLLLNQHVTIYDNFMYGPNSILHLISNPKLKVITGDIRDKKKINSEVSKNDFIIHLAAVVGYPACSKDEKYAIETNVTGTKNVFSKISKDQKFIFASTGSTYGRVQEKCDEKTLISPLTLYGKTKAEGEKIAGKSNTVILRFATVFGLSPRLRLDLLINDFTYKAYHEKHLILYQSNYKRTFIHCRDAVDFILLSIKKYSKMKGEVFNVGSDKLNFTKIEIANKISNATKCLIFSSDRGTDPDERNYEVSYKKIKKLGFNTKITVEDGIEELLKIVKNIHLKNPWSNA